MGAFLTQYLHFLVCTAGFNAYTSPDYLLTIMVLFTGKVNLISLFSFCFATNSHSQSGTITTDTMATRNNNSGGGLFTSSFTSSSSYTTDDVTAQTPSAKPVTGELALLQLTCIY